MSWPADVCRERGWKPGDWVGGPDAFGAPARVRITAIGSRLVLAAERSGRYGEREDSWSISWDAWALSAPTHSEGT